jgi:hypothetical protein
MPRVLLLVLLYRLAFVVCKLINYSCALKVIIMHIIIFSSLVPGAVVVDTRLVKGMRLLRKGRGKDPLQFFIQVLCKFKQCQNAHVLKVATLDPETR